MIRHLQLASALVLAGATMPSCAATSSPEAVSAAQIAPRLLRCENLDNPVGIDEAHPRLSWIVASHQRGARQTAYRILVAGNPSELAAGRGDLWDSGKVLSDRTSQIRYAGPKLTSTQCAWWKVRTWDENGEPSAWSDPARWETGLLSASEWHGQWIARTTDVEVRPMPLLRRSFDLDGTVKRARAYISGLGYYELRLNGAKVGDHLLDPGYTRYDRRVLYVAYDITDQLHRGANVVGAMLGNGWFNVQTKATWNFDRAPWRAAPRLLVELRIELTDGRTLTLASDERWKTSDGPIAFSSIYGGENHDARLEQNGWDASPFDDAKWEPAVVVDAPKGRLAAQVMHPIKLDQTLRPQTVTEVDPGVFVFDGGQNLTGNAELVLSAPAGTTIKMCYGEKLDSRGRVDQANIAEYVWPFGAGQQVQTDQYTAKGGGEERWTSRFTYHGFRYIEITGAPGRLTANNLRIRFFHSGVPAVGAFECSNPLMNKIWTNGRWSYLSNLFGIPTDCPHREKNGWSGDAQIACEQGLFYADGLTVYEKWVDDLAAEQRATGAFPGIAPSTGEWGWRNKEYGSFGPAWDSAVMLVPWYLYTYYGDASALTAHYENYKLYLDYLASRATFGSPEASPQQTHLVEVGLGDWSPWKTKTPAVVTDTAYYYRDAQIVAAVARMLGKTADAQKYEALAAEIRTAFNRQLYQPESGSYSNGSQAALGCALFQGLVEPQNEQRVLHNLLAALARNDGHLDFGFLGAKYVLNTLTDHGRADVAYALVNQKTKPGWGWQVENGATTLWEHWNSDSSHGIFSLNHTMFGDVNAWMMKTIAGISPDPATPGFRRVLIRPSPVGDLTWAKGSYDSIRGRIVSEWTLQGGIFRLHVSIPANCTATVLLPTIDAAAVRESDRALGSDPNVVLRGVEKGCLQLETGSGDYSFEFPIKSSRGESSLHPAGASPASP